MARHWKEWTREELTRALHQLGKLSRASEAGEPGLLLRQMLADKIGELERSTRGMSIATEDRRETFNRATGGVQALEIFLGEHFGLREKVQAVIRQKEILDREG